MYIDLHNKKRVRTNSKWLIFTIFMILVIVTEQFYRQPLKEVSLSVIKTLQGEDPKNNNAIKFLKFISQLGSKMVFIPITIIVYNYANIYKTFTLLMALLISTAEFSILKMIYEGPRPYFIDLSIIPIDCEGGWGNPSGHSLSSMAFYLTLWHIITECKQIRDKKIIKIISLIFTILLIISIMFSRIVLGAHSINQILFGGLMGYGVYYFLFNVLCIRLNDGKQFAKILNFKNIMFLAINFLIFLFAFLVYYFNELEIDIIDKYDAIIKEKCHGIPFNLKFQNEALLNIAIYLANIGAFIGIKFEYFFLFGENLDNWNQFNFEMNEINDDSSLMTKITINRETQWNHTNNFFSILRLFIIVVLSAILVFPYFLIEWDYNIVLVFLFKLVVPSNTITFAYFFLFKKLLKGLRMVNMTLYSLNDSL